MSFKTGLISESLFLDKLSKIGEKYGFKVIHNTFLDRRGIDAIIRFKDGPGIKIQIKEEISSLLGRENRNWLFDKYRRAGIDYLVILDKPRDILSQWRNFILKSDDEEWLENHIDDSTHFIHFLIEDKSL